MISRLVRTELEQDPPVLRVEILQAGGLHLLGDAIELVRTALACTSENRPGVRQVGRGEGDGLRAVEVHIG